MSAYPLRLLDQRVVVLGATGFIGRWVARSFSESGARVWLAARDTRAAQRIAADYGISGTTVEIDVTQAADLAALLREVRPALTVNMAGYGVDRREVDRDLAQAINLDLVRRLLELVRSECDPVWPGLAFLHAGSALEYGTTPGHLEEDGPATPTTVYGIAKLAATRAIEAAVREGAVRAVTARLFTVYGPGEHEGRLLPSVLSARGTMTPIPMTNGYQKRDFTYVGDVAEGFLRAATRRQPAFPTINLATGSLHTVREFVAAAERALGMPPGRFQFGALSTRTEEMAHDEVSVSRAREWLDWVPSTGIEAGVLATDAFIRSRPPLTGP